MDEMQFKDFRIVFSFQETFHCFASWNVSIVGGTFPSFCVEFAKSDQIVINLPENFSPASKLNSLYTIKFCDFRIFFTSFGNFWSSESVILTSSNRNLCTLDLKIP